MSDFEKLKDMDIEEIYHKTFIARKYIKALLDKDFSKFDRLKALGFVKILEREFDFDLSDLKKEIDEYFVKKSLSKPEEEHDSNIENLNQPQNRKNIPIIIPFLIILVVIIAAIFYFFTPKEVKKESIVKKEVTKEKFFEKNVSKEKALISEANISEDKSEENITKEQVIENEENLSNEEAKAILPTVAIVPKQKVWIGIIYLDDYSRKNYVTSFPVELNTSRDQLIVTGHGNIKIDVDGNVTDYSSKDKLRFLYRAGEIEKIDKDSFIRFNRGKNW